MISESISDKQDLQISKTSIEPGEESNMIEPIIDILTPYPKYYTRRRKEQLSSVKEATENIDQQPSTEVEATENMNDWPIAIRKQKRTCV